MTQDGTWVDESDWQLDDSEIAESGAAPVVAVVGRPNVGKSTLVNRILGRREAVVQDIPGVTRDRVCYDALWTGRRFVVQDTGGWEPNAKGLQRLVAEQASVAMRTADAVILVVDAGVGATAADEAAAVSCCDPASRCSWPPTRSTAKKANPTPRRCGRWAWVSRMRSARCTVGGWPTCSTGCSPRCPRWGVRVGERRSSPGGAGR